MSAELADDPFGRAPLIAKVMRVQLEQNVVNMVIGKSPSETADRVPFCPFDVHLQQIDPEDSSLVYATNALRSRTRPRFLRPRTFQSG